MSNFLRFISFLTSSKLSRPKLNAYEVREMQGRTSNLPRRKLSERSNPSLNQAKSLISPDSIERHLDKAFAYYGGTYEHISTNGSMGDLYYSYSRFFL